MGNSALHILSFLIMFIGLQGCASYTTPAAGVDIAAIGDADIAELMAVEPASQFPARVAVVRVQEPGYYTATNTSFGAGNYSVVTTRDIESEADLLRLSQQPQLAGVAPVGRLLLPSHLQSIKDLRLAAAKLKADMLLLYTVDTAFHVEGTALGPLSAITLGFLPNKQAFVTATTAGMLVDVRTGYVYGIAEASSREEQRASMWNTSAAIDEARVDAEAASFKSFVNEFEQLWAQTLAQYKKAD